MNLPDCYGCRNGYDMPLFHHPACPAMFGVPPPMGMLPDPPPPATSEEIIRAAEDEVLGWVGAESPRGVLRRLITYRYLYARGCRIDSCDDQAINRAAKALVGA